MKYRLSSMKKKMYCLSSEDVFYIADILDSWNSDWVVIYKYIEPWVVRKDFWDWIKNNDVKYIVFNKNIWCPAIVVELSEEQLVQCVLKFPADWLEEISEEYYSDLWFDHFDCEPQALE